VSAAWQRVRDLPPRWVLGIGFAVAVLYGFPGYMSTDSVTQLIEARAGAVRSMHPPIMAKLWWFLDSIVAGPLLMLMLQNALMLFGLHRIFVRFATPKRAAWIAIGILLYPPVLTTMAVIWKDSQMVAYLVAGTAAMLDERLRVRILGIVLLVVACAYRHNAAAAVVPIVILVFEWRSPISWTKRISVIGGLSVVCVILGIGLTRVLSVSPARVTPVIADVSGMIAFTEPRSDEDLRQVLRGVPIAVNAGIQERARKLYMMGGVGRLTMSDERVFLNPSNEAEWLAFGRAWTELFTDDPGSYFASHWFLYRRVIGLDETPRATVWDGFLEDGEQRWSVSHDARWGGLQRWIKDACAFVSDHTPLFRPWIYAAIAVLILITAARSRIAWALLTSGILYELTFFIANADPDYRYSHWMITSTCIGIVIVFLQRSKARAT
jgi:hypothetical protein